MTAARHSTGPGVLQRGRRAGSALELVLLSLLGVASILFAVGYVICLLYLLIKGAGKIASFTTYASPLAGVDNESAMRFVVAVCAFGVIAWAVLASCRAVASRYHWWTSSVDRVGVIVAVVVARGWRYCA